MNWLTSTPLTFTFAPDKPNPPPCIVRFGLVNDAPVIVNDCTVTLKDVMADRPVGSITCTVTVPLWLSVGLGAIRSVPWPLPLSLSDTYVGAFSNDSFNPSLPLRSVADTVTVSSPPVVIVWFGIGTI